MLALAARRASRELSSAQRKVSDTDSISYCSTEPPSGLRALCVTPSSTCSSSTCRADGTKHACAVITSSNSRICAASSASAAAASHAGPTLAMPQHKTSRLLSLAAARVRSLAAVFEAARTSSSSHKLTSPAAAAMQFEDCLDFEADAAVLVANRCVKQLTATWESLSAGGSAAGSECSSPSASFTCQKPISRPVTAGAPTANTYIPGPQFTTSPAGVSAAAVAAASKAEPDPAAAVRQCWRQESGQLGSIIRLLLPPAAEVGYAATTAGGGSNPAPAMTLPQDSAPTQQVQSEDWGSVVCRAAVWAGLVSCGVEILGCLVPQAKPRRRR